MYLTTFNDLILYPNIVSEAWESLKKTVGNDLATTSYDFSKLWNSSHNIPGIIVYGYFHAHNFQKVYFITVTIPSGLFPRILNQNIELPTCLADQQQSKQRAKQTCSADQAYTIQKPSFVV